MTPAVVSLGFYTAELAHRIAVAIDGEVITTDAAPTTIPALFRQGRPIIGLCAAGILIRLLAPEFGDKHAEPPVLAVSADGTYVVPLLGGHRGANGLARQIANAIGAVAALTTASETRFSRALDDPPPGYRLVTPEAVKPAVVALLSGASIALEGEAPWLREAGYPLDADGSVKVRVSATGAVRPGELVYRPQTLVAGIGAERGVGTEEVVALITATLAEMQADGASLAALATVDLKADETAFHDAARHFGVPLRLFSVAELDAERERLVTPSAIVAAEIGTPGVAEAAALKAGTLAMSKRKSARATCALGMAPAPLVDLTKFGRAPGQLHVIGIGPGDVASRTESAAAALTAAGEWVGYGLYLDLVADLAGDRAQHRFPLGDEEARVRFALERAGEGRTVALVCSGDAQIYAMASLVFELLEAADERALSPSARRVAVEVHPGISAMQAASARAGALLGHDFCAISLSDLLTPIETIRRRLGAAATGDFVTAFYNPRSQRRTALLEEAHRMFQSHRPPETPVLVASNLGRSGESVAITTLAAFDPATVDMLTIVVFGASSSRRLQRGDGRTYAYTPRGYAAKAGTP